MRAAYSFSAYHSETAAEVLCKYPSKNAEKFALTPEFTENFVKWYKERYGDSDLTESQLKRAMERAEARALRAEESLQAEATLHKQELQNKDTAWRIYATAQQRNDRRSVRERVIYWQVYDGLTEELMERERYRKAKDSQKAELLGLDRRKKGGNDYDSRRVANLMNNLPGWKKSSRLVRVPIYGPQWVYYRNGTEPQEA